MKHVWQDTLFTTEDPEVNIYGFKCEVCGEETTEEFNLESDDCGADHE